MSFSPIQRSERLSDQVAGQLLETIVSQRLAAGSRLPSERELGEQFGVSRTVIREAVRDLAARGVLEVRSGSGVRVGRLDVAPLLASMNVFLRWQDLGYAQVHEVRTAIETQTARAAAARATDADVAGLRASVERTGSFEGRTDRAAIEAAAVEDVEFHRLVARATQNPLFLVMLDSIGDVLLEIRRATVGIPGRVALASVHHARVLARIAAHDEAGAEAAMRDHLAESQEAWQEIQP